MSKYRRVEGAYVPTDEGFRSLTDEELDAVGGGAFEVRDGRADIALGVFFTVAAAAAFASGAAPAGVVFLGLATLEYVEGSRDLSGRS